MIEIDRGTVSKNVQEMAGNNLGTKLIQIRALINEN